VIALASISMIWNRDALFGTRAETRAGVVTEYPGYESSEAFGGSHGEDPIETNYTSGGGGSSIMFFPETPEVRFTAFAGGYNSVFGSGTVFVLKRK